MAGFLQWLRKRKYSSSEPCQEIRHFPGATYLPGRRSLLSQQNGARYFYTDTDKGNIPLSESCREIKHFTGQPICRAAVRFWGNKNAMVVFRVAPSTAVLFRGGKAGRPMSSAHFVRCVMVWANFFFPFCKMLKGLGYPVEIAGSSPTCGIF